MELPSRRGPNRPGLTHQDHRSFSGMGAEPIPPPRRLERQLRAPLTKLICKLSAANRSEAVLCQQAFAVGSQQLDEIGTTAKKKLVAAKAQTDDQIVYKLFAALETTPRIRHPAVTVRILFKGR